MENSGSFQLLLELLQVGLTQTSDFADEFSLKPFLQHLKGNFTFLPPLAYRLSPIAYRLSPFIYHLTPLIDADLEEFVGEQN